MEFTEVVKERRSVRKFINKRVEREKFESIVKIASYAPSWKNTQTTRYIFVEDRKTIKEIAENCVMGFEFNSNIIKNAPAVVVLSNIKGRCGYERDGSFSTSKEDRWEMFDAGISAQTFCLAAHELGLGTVIMGVFDEIKLKDTIELSEDQSISAIIAIGYSDEKPVMPKRKDLEVLIRYI